MVSLLFLAVEDFRYHKVSMHWLIVMGGLASIYQVLGKENTMLALTVGLGIGGIFLVISFITREAIGYGDSILICILGIYVGGTELMEILMIAWGLSGLTAMIILVRKNFTKSAVLPFIPFLAAGYGIVSLGKYLHMMTGSV